MRSGLVVGTDDHAAKRGASFRFRHSRTAGAATSTATNIARKMSARFIFSVSWHKWAESRRPERTNRPIHTVLPILSVGLGAPGFDRVSFFVNHGVPAFSDRSAGKDFLVNSRVGFQHAAKIAKIERTLPGNLREAGSKAGIIENSSEFLRKCRSIAS